MIKIEDTEIMGMRKAIKGMRNAMNSWDKSDSYIDEPKADMFENCANCRCGIDPPTFIIGEEDMKLAKRLIKAGSSDRKFMRMIHVQADVTAPLYWWKEYDTYKVGTTSNSCSTMHTIHKCDLDIYDFSHEHLDILPTFALPKSGFQFSRVLEEVVDTLNYARKMYLETNDKRYWWQMIQLLPSSFNQMRTIDLDYETLFSIYYQRKNHKLDEWKEFCKWIISLPYMKEFLES